MSSPRVPESAFGFTLLEVLLAIFVFTISMGALISTVSSSTATLARARARNEASRLAEEQLRTLLDAPAALEIGREEGAYESDRPLRWELTVEPHGIVLPEEVQDRSDSSSIFESADSSMALEEPSLRRVTLRVFAEDSDKEIIAPFVVFEVAPSERNPGAGEGTPQP